MSINTFKQRAIHNAISSIRCERRFPRQVFAANWAEYLFFYPELLFEARFVEVKNLLLREENASLIAVVNLGNSDNKKDVEPKALFLDRETTANDYVAALMGDRSATSWMFLMDRYVCASDKGHWSVYCEKENDVAVLAVNQTVSRFTCSQLAKLLNATSIGAAPTVVKGHLFDVRKLVPEWQSALTSAYQSSDR